LGRHEGFRFGRFCESQYREKDQQKAKKANQEQAEKGVLEVMNGGDWEDKRSDEKRIAPLDAWPFGRPPARIGEAKPEDAEKRADVRKNMDDSDCVCSEQEHWGTQEVKMVSHPAMVVGEVVPDDVRCDSNCEGQENGKRSADWMGTERFENITVAVWKHFERGRAQEVEGCKNHEARRDAEQKAFDGVMSERAEVESAEKIAGVGTNAAGDECGEAEVAGT